MIAGKYRGKRLISPEDNRVRPTSDRIKETMFNILFSKGVGGGIKVLDLFAGTGALGIEALSRGAEECVFTDIDVKSCALVRENLKITGIKGEVYHAEFKAAIPKLTGRKFDLILIDPPYKQNRECEIVNLIIEHGILAENGVAVIEHDRENLLAELDTRFSRDTRICGNTALTFLSVAR